MSKRCTGVESGGCTVNEYWSLNTSGCGRCDKLGRRRCYCNDAGVNECVHCGTQNCCACSDECSFCGRADWNE